MTFRHEYEIRMDRVAALKEQIATQLEAVHKASNAAYENVVGVIDSRIAGDQLQKVAGHHGFLKAANANAQEQLRALRKLKAECIRAQDYANEELGSFGLYCSDMRSKIPPIGSPRFLR
jgi:GMP synthase PP-ATPase subunit